MSDKKTIENQEFSKPQKQVSEKVVLAYSGGLDTSCILKWLIDKGYEVICYIADVGQDEDYDAVKEKALKIGATKVYVEDLKEEFVKDFIFPAIKANAVYEGRYLLGTSLARPLIAKKHIEIAQKEGAKFVSHGATGKGNDQVRFELTYAVLDPTIEIIAPWKDEEFLAKFEGRNDLLDYAKENNIEVKATKDEPWSTDPNLMHISYEAGELEDPNLRPRKSMFEMTTDPKDAPDEETVIEITFEKGVPISVKNETTGEKIKGALKLFTYLNDVAGKNGVGRIDIVENRFVGMKSRGVYETPAGTVLLAAHMDIEALTVDREVVQLKNTLMPKYSQLVYNGFWYAPEMDFIMSAINQSQEYVTGTVKIALYKGNVTIVGRASPNTLYDKEIASMDVHGGYDQKDAKGFIKLNALRLKAYAKQKKNKKVK